MACDSAAYCLAPAGWPVAGAAACLAAGAAIGAIAGFAGAAAVAGAGDIAEEAVPLEPGDVGLERGDFLGVEKAGDRDIAAAAELLNVSRGKLHGVG